MYPNNQYPPQSPLPGQMPPSNQQDPYGFITNSPQAQNSNLKGPAGTKGRIIVVVIGAIILIVALIIVMNILGQAGKAQTQNYIEIAKRQTEIIRISTLAEQKARSLETKNLATTTRLSFTSAQKDMNSLLSKKGVSEKALSKQLSLSKNSKTDQLLEDAEKNSRYDETYTEIVLAEIDNYKKQINAASGGAVASEKTVLEYSFNQATLLQPLEKEN